MIVLPQAGRGRRSAAQQEAYRQALMRFTGSILEIRSRLDFSVSSRGWCYILEEYGLEKGDFDRAQDLINDCRKTGLLPINICAEDGARHYENVEELDTDDLDEYTQDAYASMDTYVHTYTPVSFWEGKDVFLAMWVEKIDLKESICSDL